MPWNFLSRLLLSHIPHSEFFITACGYQKGSIGAPRKRLYDVVVLEGELSTTGLDIPDLYGIVARRTGKDVFGGRVEQHMADLPMLWLDVPLYVWLNE